MTTDKEDGSMHMQTNMLFTFWAEHLHTGINKPRGNIQGSRGKLQTGLIQVVSGLTHKRNKNSGLFKEGEDGEEGGVTNYTTLWKNKSKQGWM